MEFNFSFNSYCNRAKRIFQPDSYKVPIWLPYLESEDHKEETKANRKKLSKKNQEIQKSWSEEEKQAYIIYSEFFFWLAKGMKFGNKMWYPVYFGGKSQEYPGSLANEEIMPQEEIMRISGTSILSTQVAVLTEEMQPLFKHFPLFFSPRCSDWQNYVLAAYILRERQKIRRKEHSIWSPFMKSWPTQFDLLEVWEEEQLQELQDQSLLNKAMQNYVKMTECWTNFYSVASKFPELYEESSITVNEFQWSWNIQTTRCFESQNSISMIVPYADLINHQNTGVDYDVFGPDGISIKQKKKQLKGEEKEENKQEEEDDLSSQVSSEYDYDVVFKDEVVHIEKKIQGMKLQESKEEQKLNYHLDKENSIKTKQSQQQLQEYYRSEEFKDYWWGRTLATVKQHPLPSQFEFVVKNGKEKFLKGSQIYLSYGNLSNRDLLLRYGFCLKKNKYNNVNLKMVLHPTSKDFPYKRFMLQKLFKLSKDNEGGLKVQARCFKLYFQELNCNVIKFMKIINYERTNDAVQGVFQTRSVSTEIKALTSYETQLSELLTSMGSSVIRDEARLKSGEYQSSRQKWALIYRSEVKNILLNQLKLLRIAREVLLRLKKGFTLDYAVMRVHDYEQLNEVAIHRHMLRKYLNSLKRGLETNKAQQNKVEEGTAKLYKKPGETEEEDQEDDEDEDEEEEDEEEEETQELEKKEIKDTEQGGDKEEDINQQK